MQTARTIALLTALSIATLALPFAGCEKKAAEPPKPAAGAAPAKADGQDHKEGDGHDHGHGPATQLGEQKAGDFNVKASRDGAITPGKDAPIDVWVTGGTAKVAAVRFWIGTQDAKGSVKAKAEIENNNWHTHAEIPNPLPEGSMLWVEIEDDKGVKSVVGFDLKL